MPQLLVVLVGVPGSGKSTFAQHLLADAGTTDDDSRAWRRVSQDVLKTRKRCVASTRAALRAGEHVLIDRCNFDRVQRSHWLQAAADYETELGLLARPTTGDEGAGNDGVAESTCAPLICLAVHLPIDMGEAKRRVLNRDAHEGGVDAFSMTDEKIEEIVARMHGSMRPPQRREGFDEVLQVATSSAGTTSSRGLMCREAAVRRIHAIAAGEGQVQGKTKGAFKGVV